MKTCNRCQTEKDRSEFNKSKRSPDGLQHWCRECMAEGHRIKKYGLTDSQLEEMKAKQKNRCAHCLVITKLVVDHCHISGMVRALLCSSCNWAEGHLPKHTLAFSVFWETVNRNLEEESS